MYRDALHDVYLTSYGYLPIWNKFFILHKATSDHYYYKAFSSLYEDIKKFKLPEGYEWGDFMPQANPVKKWHEWAGEAREFLPDPEGYMDIHISFKPQEDWSKAHEVTGPQFSFMMKTFFKRMNLCTEYDGIWPRVAFNYRMLHVDAFVNKHMKKAVMENKKIYSVLPPVEWLTE